MPCHFMSLAWREPGPWEFTDEWLDGQMGGCYHFMIIRAWHLHRLLTHLPIQYGRLLGEISLLPPPSSLFPLPAYHVSFLLAHVNDHRSSCIPKPVYGSNESPIHLLMTCFPWHGDKHRDCCGTGRGKRGARGGFCVYVCVWAVGVELSYPPGQVSWAVDEPITTLHTTPTSLLL